jgi:hypothetical protein
MQAAMEFEDVPTTLCDWTVDTFGTERSTYLFTQEGAALQYDAVRTWHAVRII